MNFDRLRQLLLQKAIEGTLIPGTSSATTYPLNTASDAQPFPVPQTWSWKKLEDLFLFIDYRGKTPTKTSHGIRLMTASNVRQGYIDHSRVEYISVEEFELRKSRGVSKKGDILFTTEAPLGFAALADLDTYSAGQRVITLQSDPKVVNNQLYVFFFLSPNFQRELLRQATGTTAKGIKAARLKKLLVPVPPIEEQHRIVARLNELLSVIKTAEDAYTDLQSLGKTLRERILQKAFEGKLVPQKDSELPVSFNLSLKDSIPFTIPEKWGVMTLKDVSTKITDGEHKTPKYLPQGVPFLSVKDISTGHISFANTKYISEEDCDCHRKRCNPEKGDVLVTKVGTTGVPALVDTDQKFSLFVSIALIKPNPSLILSTYLYFLIQSSFLQNHVKETTRGLNKNWVIKEIATTVIPVPPLEEQRRIVAKLNELLPLVDQMTAV